MQEAPKSMSGFAEQPGDSVGFGCESSHRIARATSLDQHQSWEPSFVRVQGCAKCTKAARPQMHSC